MAPQQWFVAEGLLQLVLSVLQGRAGKETLILASFKGWASRCVYGGGNLSLIEQHRRCPSTPKLCVGELQHCVGSQPCRAVVPPKQPEQQMGPGWDWAYGWE